MLRVDDLFSDLLNMLVLSNLLGVLVLSDFWVLSDLFVLSVFWMLLVVGVSFCMMIVVPAFRPSFSVGFCSISWCMAMLYCFDME